MIDKDKVVSEDEQDISQEEQALQIEENENPQNFITPSASPTREVMPQRCEGVIHPSHPRFKPKRYSAPKIRGRDKLEQEKMFLQEIRAEQNLSASELRLIDNTINQIEEEIKNLAEDLCAGPVSKSQKREGPSGDRDPGAGICSITVRRHTGTVICKSELNQEIDCHRKQMRTLLDAKFKRQKCIIKLQKQVDIDTSTIVFYQNLALKGEIKLLFLKKQKKRKKENRRES